MADTRPKPGPTPPGPQPSADREREYAEPFAESGAGLQSGPGEPTEGEE
jgi:hypothetical protein